LIDVSASYPPRDTPHPLPELMNEATARRLEIARRVASFYAANPKVAVVLVAGSVGAGNADRYSDLELDIFWSAPPTDEERCAPVEAAGGTVKTLFPFEDDEWAEELLIDGLKADTSMFLVETLDRWLAEVVEGISTEESPQYLIAAVQHSVPLHGEAIVRRWREKAASYPDALARAMVARHLRPSARWYYAEMLAERGDLVFLHEIIAPVVATLLRALHGLNRRYVAHPNLKWMDRIAAELTIAPADLAARLRRVYRAPPMEGVRELQSLLEETLALVEREMPGLDTGEARRWIADRRAPWPPAG
jgi:hypothetical protein